MGNPCPRPAGKATRAAFTGLLACIAIVSIAIAPDSAVAHGGEKHPAPAAQKPRAAEPQPAPHVEPETPALLPGDVSADPIEPASLHPYPPQGVPLPLAWLGKFHPSLTHFPIALLLAAALAELLLLRRPNEPLLRHAVRFCIWGGALGALLAAPLGWLFAGFRLVDDEWLMTAHRWTGTAAAAWAVLLLFLSERAARGEGSRTPLRLGLFPGALLVGASGFLGGSLIYGLDHFNWGS